MIAQRAVQEWLSARSATAERSADLSALIRSQLPDRLVRRSFERQVEAIADGVDRRLMTLLESDRALLDAQADPILLAERIRQGLADPRRQLGEAGTQLHDILLEKCVECVVRILQQLPQYLPRVATELLGRTAQLDELGKQVATILARLPARTLYAPSRVQDMADEVQ